MCVVCAMCLCICVSGHRSEGNTFHLSHRGTALTGPEVCYDGLWQTRPSPPPIPQSAGITDGLHANMPFYMGAEDPSSGPHACKESSLSTDHSLALPVSCLEIKAGPKSQA